MNTTRLWRELTEFQDDHFQWLSHNFPDQRPHDGLLGLIEEVGELAHAHLKKDQNIRGYDHGQYMIEAKDAVGDIVIYLASYCNTNGINLGQAVQEAWDEVRNRDWVKYPHTGRPPQPEAEVRSGSD